MKLLLDTHAALWWLADDRRMGDEAARALLDPANEVLLSAAVVWEVAIKRSLGKLAVEDDFSGTLRRGGARFLAVSVAHATAAERLPWHHRDPFDRMLVAQALSEHAGIISREQALARYGVPLIW